MQIDIPPNERGLIRVFAVSRPPLDVTSDISTQGKSAVAKDLLGHAVPEGHFELFPTSDLSGVGLPAYLSDGHAVPSQQVSDYRVKLDALDGYVLLVFSKAFDGHEVTLNPSADLTLIGTFGEALPDMKVEVIESAAAQAYSGVPRQTPAQPAKGPAGSALVVVGLIVMVGLVLWLVLR